MIWGVFSEGELLILEVAAESLRKWGPSEPPLLCTQSECMPKETGAWQGLQLSPLTIRRAKMKNSGK